MINQVGSLQLMKNQFNYCLRSSHHSLESSGKSNHVVVQTHFVNGKTTQVNDLRPCENRLLKEDLDIFFDIIVYEQVVSLSVVAAAVVSVLQVVKI